MASHKRIEAKHLQIGRGYHSNIENILDIKQRFEKSQRFTPLPSQSNFSTLINRSSDAKTSHSYHLKKKTSKPILGLTYSSLKDTYGRLKKRQVIIKG